MKNKFNFQYFSTLYEPMWFLLSKIKIKKNKNINNKKILIINPCLIGDFCSSIHFIKKFISNHSGYEIDVLVEKNIVDFATNIKDIGSVYAYNKLNSKNKNEYEKVIILRSNYKLLKFCEKIYAKEVVTNFKTFLNFGTNIAKSYISRKYPKSFLDMNFNILNYEKKIYSCNEIFKEPENIIKFDILNSKKENNIIVHTQASWIMNQWNLKNWIELIEKIHNKNPEYNFIFIGGGKKEQENFNIISRKLNFKVHSIVGKISLFELLMLIKKSGFFIGVDSGPANISYLTNIKSITIGGPGPHLFLPYRKNKIFIDKSNKRNFIERFVCRKKRLINSITPKEAYNNFLLIKKSK